MADDAGSVGRQPVTGQEDRSLTGTDSFTRFYNEWYARGVGFAERLGGDILTREDAMEVALDAMKVVNAAWGNIATPEAYFQSVVRLRTIDRFRANLRRSGREVPIPATPVEGSEGISREVLAALTSMMTPERSFQEREDAVALDAVLRLMPDHYRISLSLAAEGYSAEERATIKDIPVTTERSHLRRAREMCIRLISSMDPENKSEAINAAEKLMTELSQKEGEET
ncbi:hypothetical protein OG613_44515 (plasmid) [Streptomyces sp. NBC_00015]|uniref:RNA polymerase sigma factor n=1 Tax=Streptomyces sp. NBC_00015 TaxID=2903611 RepID=UPI002F91BB6E